MFKILNIYLLHSLIFLKKLVFLLIWPPVCYYAEFSVGLSENISTVGWPNGHWLYNSWSLIGAEDEPVENVAMCFADLKRKKKKDKTVLCSKAGTLSGLVLLFRVYSDGQCMNIKHKTGPLPQSKPRMHHWEHTAFQVLEELSC